MPVQEIQPLVGYTTPDAWSVHVHLMHFLGPPAAVWEAGEPRGLDPRRKSKIDVGAWMPMGPGSMTMLCTVGGCDRAMPDGRFAEVFMLVRPAPDDATVAELAAYLRHVVRAPAFNGWNLEPGRRVELHDAPRVLAPFRGILLLPALTFREEFREVRFKNGKRVKMLWLVPLHGAEWELCRTRGPDALYRHLGERQVDVAVLSRPSSL